MPIPAVPADVVQVSPTVLRRLVGKTCAALGAATGQDLAAVGGSHSLAEAVDLLAVELLGLVGTFRSHVETPPVIIPAGTLSGTYSTPFFEKKGAVNLFRASFDALVSITYPVKGCQHKFSVFFYFFPWNPSVSAFRSRIKRFFLKCGKCDLPFSPSLPYHIPWQYRPRRCCLFCPQCRKGRWKTNLII